MKLKIQLLVSSLSGAMAFLSIVQAALFVSGDISSGVLRGEPETGWGILLALFMLLPIALVTGLISFIYGNKYLRSTNKPKWIIPFLALIIGLVLLSGWFYNDNVNKRPVNTKDTSLESRIRQLSNEVQADYFKNGTLPEQTNDKYIGINYKVLDKTKAIYQLCGDFASSTLEYYSGDVAQKVKEGTVLSLSEASGVYLIHGIGKQCFNIRSSN
jgi:hypothetical protein